MQNDFKAILNIDVDRGPRSSGHGGQALGILGDPAMADKRDTMTRQSGMDTTQNSMDMRLTTMLLPLDHDNYALCEDKLAVSTTKVGAGMPSRCCCLMGNCVETRRTPPKTSIANRVQDSFELSLP